MNAPLRRRAWLPLVVLALCVVGPLALAQPPGFPRGPQFGGNNPNGGMPNAGMPNGGMPNGGMPDMGMEKIWICQKCNHQWPDAGGGPPTACPKCGAKFSQVTDINGRTTQTEYGRTTGNVKLYIFLGVVVIAVIAALIRGAIALSAGSGSKKRKKKKKVRRPRDDDDDY